MAIREDNMALTGAEMFAADTEFNGRPALCYGAFQRFSGFSPLFHTLNLRSVVPGFHIRAPSFANKCESAASSLWLKMAKAHFDGASKRRMKER
jgi:hypothetical protein